MEEVTTITPLDKKKYATALVQASKYQYLSEPCGGQTGTTNQ